MYAMPHLPISIAFKMKGRASICVAFDPIRNELF
ncbi:MAG: hypothetical protein KAH18_04725 [Psychromonas sp.]|nr:hypothetical protein [Psychromonas sp.]